MCIQWSLGKQLLWRLSSEYAWSEHGRVERRFIPHNPLCQYPTLPNISFHKLPTSSRIGARTGRLTCGFIGQLATAYTVDGERKKRSSCSGRELSATCLQDAVEGLSIAILHRDRRDETQK
jgi:hypothetical protein